MFYWALEKIYCPQNSVFYPGYRTKWFNGLLPTARRAYTAIVKDLHPPGDLDRPPHGTLSSPRKDTSSPRKNSTPRETPSSPKKDSMPRRTPSSPRKVRMSCRNPSSTRKNSTSNTTHIYPDSLFMNLGFSLYDLWWFKHTRDNHCIRTSSWRKWYTNSSAWANQSGKKTWPYGLNGSAGSSRTNAGCNYSLYACHVSSFPEHSVRNFKHAWWQVSELRALSPSISNREYGSKDGCVLHVRKFNADLQ